MKLTKISIVTLLPLALCTAVPEASIRIEKGIGLEGLSTPSLFPELTIEQGLALFFREAHRVANEAIQSHAEALGIKEGPHNLSELFETIFSNEAIHAAQSLNATGTNPFTGLFDDSENATTTISNLFAGLFADLGNTPNSRTSLTAGNPTMLIMDSVAGLPGGLDKLNTTINTTPLATNTPIMTNPLLDLLNGITNGLGSLTSGILGGLVNATAGILGGILGMDTKNSTGTLGTILGSGLNSTNATTSAVIEDILNTTASVLESTVNNTSMDSLLGNLGNAIGGALNMTDDVLKNDTISTILNKTTNALETGLNDATEVLQTISNITEGTLNGTNDIGDFPGSVLNSTDGIGNVIGGALNNTISTVTDVLNTVPSAVGVILDGSDRNKCDALINTSENNLGNVLNSAIESVFNCVATITVTALNNTQCLENAISNPFSDTPDPFGTIEDVIKNPFTVSPLLGPALLASLLGQIAINANNSILNVNTLKAITEFIDGIISSAQNGPVPIVSLIDAIVQIMSKFAGSDNPFGSFLQNLAAFVFQNQAGILSNVIKFGSFFEPISRAILSLVAGIATNFNQHAQNTLHNIIIGVLIKVLNGGILHFRLQDISAEHLQSMLVGTLSAQNSTEQAFDIVHRMARNALSDPVVSSIIGTPTEDNMARVIVIFAKALSEHLSISTQGQ